jgi:hypothetical protein
MDAILEKLIRKLLSEMCHLSTCAEKEKEQDKWKFGLTVFRERGSAGLKCQRWECRRRPKCQKRDGYIERGRSLALVGRV